MADRQNLLDAHNNNVNTVETDVALSPTSSARGKGSGGFAGCMMSPVRYG